MSDDREERALVGMLQRIAIALERIATLNETEVFIEEEILAGNKPLPESLTILQGGKMITGVPVGGSGTFVESFVPTNAALPVGAVLSVVWTVDDPLVTLAPSADGTSVVASVGATDTAAAFNLTATGSSAALPAPITSGPVSVPIIPLPPPLPTSLSVTQTA
jgi:hypothetical protein